MGNVAEGNAVETQTVFWYHAVNMFIPAVTLVILTWVSMETDSILELVEKFKKLQVLEL